jgi:hypothetical protein
MPIPLNVKFKSASQEEINKTSRIFGKSARCIATSKGLDFHPTKDILTYDLVFRTIQREGFQSEGFNKGERVGSDCYFWNSQTRRGKSLAITIYHDQIASRQSTR